jgi:hypothetical protein
VICNIATALSGKLHPLPIAAGPFSLPEMSSDFIVTAAEFVTLDDPVERE